MTQPTPIFVSGSASLTGQSQLNSGLDKPAPSTTKLDRLGALLRALAILAAELGPIWIHSQHGTATLGAATGVASQIGSEL